jgi:hypothetical protein
MCIDFDMAASARERIESDPISTALLDGVVGILKELGEYAIEEKQTSFHVTHGRAFLGIHPRRAGLLLNIVTQRQLDPKRMHKTEQVSSRRWHNEMLLTNSAEIDENLRLWIAEAYSLTD